VRGERPAVGAKTVSHNYPSSVSPPLFLRRGGGLVSREMPFVNLPDEKESRWGDSLTAEKMKQCVWLVPKIVAQIEFLEWTGGDRLRHSKFVGLRDDKDPRMVVKEQAGE